MTTRAKVRCLATSVGVVAASAAWPSNVHAAIQCNTGTAPSNPIAAVLILLDRSGSMVGDTTCGAASPDPDDPRKWACAVSRANQTANSTDPTSERVYFVWQFRTMSDPAFTVQFNGADGEGMCKGDALALLDVDDPDFAGPVVDDAATPLAGAYCDAVDFLEERRNNAFANPNLPLHINLQTDGLENATPADHACFGTDSGGGVAFTPQVPENPVVFTPMAPPNAERVDGLLLGSWQSFLYDAMITGTAHEFPFGGAPGAVDPAAFVVPGLSGTVITIVNFIEEVIQPALGFSMLATSGTDQASELATLMAALQAAPSASLAATTPSTTEDFVGFLSGLSLSSGGRMTRMGSGIFSPPGSPNGFHVQEGDVDDSGCVDTADFNALAQVFGQAVAAANPLTFAADLNGDGHVDAADQFVLADHFGEGCPMTPGPLPVLGAALRSFEDPANWMSGQAPLAITGVHKTEGLFSLSVGGNGWREIISVPFSGSVFPSVQSKLAFDIFVPENPSNPFWLGQTLLFVSAPSANVHNAYLGAVELTGKPLNAFSPAIFNVPSFVQDLFTQNVPDISFRIAVNANDPGYLLDNLRFVP